MEASRTLLPLGPELVRKYFERALTEQRLSHAYLFVGPPESQKEAFARCLAMALYCESARACGECSACRAVEHGNHPNVNFYRRAEGKSVIEIDTVRALCERTHYRSRGLQVAVLEEGDTLGEPAANALLKTLEEPPGEAIIILTAQSTGSLLPTIVSRCFRVYFGAPASSDVSTDLPEPARSLLAQASAPGFFAGTDLRAWLAGLFPDEEGSRAVLRKLLQSLVTAGRARLSEDAQGPALDEALRRLEVFIGLRQDLDRNVSPDLVLERVLRALRRGA